MKRGQKIAIAALVFLALLLTPVVLQIIEKTNSKTMYFVANDEPLEFETTTKYALTPTVKGEIKSIKITGMVLGDGEAKVLLGDKIIFDKNLEDQEIVTITGNIITGHVVNDTEENSTELNETNTTEVNVTETNSTELNETNTTEVNVTETNTTTDNSQEEEEEEEDTTSETISSEEETESTNNTELNETNTTTNESETVEILEQEEQVEITIPEPPEDTGGTVIRTIDESIQKEFTKQCTDTCKLKDILFSEEYILEIIVENARLVIYEIEYEIELQR